MRQSLWTRAVVVCGTAVGLTAVARSAPEGGALHGTAHAGAHAVPNAVVWLDAPATPATAPRRTVVLDQRNLDFSPHVLAVQVGTIVDFPNNDRVFHNVFSFRDGKRFDLGLYPVGTVRHVTFDLPGLSRIFCNIHPNMAAYVMAVETPYYAVSDQWGRFTIDGIAPGAYTYHAWRAGTPAVTGTWTSDAGVPLTIEWP